MVTPVKKNKKSAPKLAKGPKVESVVETELQLRVGIREIRQHASQVFELVKKGESIVVTDRGEPVAVINPIVKSDYDLLVEEGAIREAEIPFDINLWRPQPGRPIYPDALEEFLRDRREARY
jgi:prevent-host-death family protein